MAFCTNLHCRHLDTKMDLKSYYERDKALKSVVSKDSKNTLFSRILYQTLEGLIHLLLLTHWGDIIILLRMLGKDMMLLYKMLQKEINKLNMSTNNYRLMINMLIEHWFREEKLYIHQYQYEADLHHLI